MADQTISNMPTDIGIIDLMIGFPFTDKAATYAKMVRGVKDDASSDLSMPAGYMFKGVPDEVDLETADPIDITFTEMDKHGIEQGLFGLSDTSVEAAKRHPGRVNYIIEVDPNDVMGAVRTVRDAVADHDLKAVSVFPAGCLPQVPVDDPKMYPLYATAVELDIAMVVNAGIAGPRLPSACQHVERFDIVCYDFPELKLIMRHGAEPWEDLAVKLMLKWPNLHYMPSAFAPKHYPKAIIDYANTRGADKIMYAGYFPAGLTVERIMTDMMGVPFRDHVWPKFLRGNAMRVLGLEPA
ncbi:MAG: amidohydrolase family protein [Acidimicrobiales bacterium]|nr:amidohydrolase family protein [Acidimicrobiales bacterium]